MCKARTIRRIGIAIGIAGERTRIQQLAAGWCNNPSVVNLTKCPRYESQELTYQGVPLRLELGPRDIANNSTLAVRRYDNDKSSISLSDVGTTVARILDEIQQTMLERASVTFNDRLKVITEWEDFVPTLDGKNIVVVPWCEVEACEDAVKTRSERQYVYLFRCYAGVPSLSEAWESSPSGKGGACIEATESRSEAEER